VHLLVSEIHRFQNARCKDKKNSMYVELLNFFRIELVYLVQKPSNVGLREETWVQVIAVLRPVDKTER
jgi:hypothetical protein